MKPFSNPFAAVGLLVGLVALLLSGLNGRAATVYPVNIGAGPNDGAGMSLRSAFDTLNTNVANLNSAISNLSIGSVVATNLNATNSNQFGLFYRNNGGVLEFLGLSQGTNVIIYRTGSNIVINAGPPGSGGSGTVSTNLQLQSLKVFGAFTNGASQWFGPNYYAQEAGGTFQIIDYVRSIPVLTVESSDGRITIGAGGTTPGIEAPTPFFAQNYLVGQATNIFSGPVRLPSLATNGIPFIDGNSNLTRLGIGSGLAVSGGNLVVSGGGGGGSSISYAAIPTSGIVGGSTLGWTTNLSANLMLVVSNLTLDTHYLIDIRSAGYMASISNYQAFDFRDAGLGGISAFPTNGTSTLEVWKDTPSGRTNAILHGPEYSLVAAGGAVLASNNLARTLTVIGGVTVATNGTTLGSGTNINFTTGFTGYVSGATLNLGVTATGSGGSGITNLVSAGNTNTTAIALVKDGTNTTGAVKTLTPGGNITFTDTGTNISIAAASSTTAGTLDTLIVTNSSRNLVQAPTIAATNAIIDVAKSPNVLLTLTTNTHLVFSNVVDGVAIGRLIVAQDTNGVRSVLSSRVVGGNLITNGNPWAYLDTNANAISRWTWATYLGTNVILFQDASYSDLVDETNALHAGKQATNAVLGNIANTGAVTNLFGGWGIAITTNSGSVVTSVTNRSLSIATNATSVTVGFSDTENIQNLNAWFHLTTNLVISPTNLVVGRTVGVYFDTNSLTYDVTVTNAAANSVNWNFFVNTNGSTSFTKTNSRRARLYLTCETNGVISAEMGYYR